MQRKQLRATYSVGLSIEMHSSCRFKHPISSIQDILYEPDKHRSQKLQQTPVRAALNILPDRWRHRRGPIIVGRQKKKRWVAADRDPPLFGELLQIYESEK